MTILMHTLYFTEKVYHLQPLYMLYMQSFEKSALVCGTHSSAFCTKPICAIPGYCTNPTVL